MHTTTRSRTRRAVAVTVLVSLVAACGSSGDDDADDADAGASETTASAATSEPVETTETTEPVETVETTTPTTDASDDPDEPEAAEADYTIELAEGISVIVPAGERADVTATISSGSLAGGDLVIELGPDGATFDDPVQVLIPPESTGEGLNAYQAELVSADGSVEVPDAVVTEAGIAWEVSHFSELKPKQYSLGRQLTPEGPVAVGDTATFSFETEGSGAHLGDDEELAAVRSAAELLGGWDVILRKGIADTEIVDKVGPQVKCLSEGGVAIWLGAAVPTASAGVWHLTAAGNIRCEEPPKVVTSDQVSATQIHDTASLPADLIAMNALSAILLAIFDEWVESYYLLVMDTDGSGVIDSGDVIPFPPQPIDPNGEVLLPIDRGGNYFIGSVPGPGDIPAEFIGFPFDDTVLGPDGVTPPGGDVPIDFIVDSTDNPVPVFYDVDFDDPLMPPMVP